MRHENTQNAQSQLLLTRYTRLRRHWYEEAWSCWCRRAPNKPVRPKHCRSPGPWRPRRSPCSYRCPGRSCPQEWRTRYPKSTGWYRPRKSLFRTIGKEEVTKEKGVEVLHTRRRTSHNLKLKGVIAGDHALVNRDTVVQERRRAVRTIGVTDIKETSFSVCSVRCGKWTGDGWDDACKN